MTNNSSILALDVGDKRIGVAIANTAARLPRPLATLLQGPGLSADLEHLIKDQNVKTVIVGLPRGLDGQDTVQTAKARQFASQLEKSYAGLRVLYQDEALTSIRAEDELTRRGQPYSRADIDALAATAILEDWLNDNQETTR